MPTMGRAERAGLTVLATATFGLAVLGFANSFAAVNEAMEPYFGVLAWTVPIGVDLGILIFGLLGIALPRLDISLPWLRLITWGLVTATVYLNVASETDLVGRVAHGVLPALWIISVEIVTHAVRQWTGIQTGQRIQRIPVWRWLLAPWSTLLLWRRMVLWQISSYSQALDREAARLLELAEMRDRYKRARSKILARLFWRARVPRRALVLYRIGQVPSPSVDRPSVRGPSPSVDRPSVRGPSPSVDRPSVADLIGPAREIAEDLRCNNVALTRDGLVTGLRATGATVSNRDATALLALLRSTQ